MFVPALVGCGSSQGQPQGQGQAPPPPEVSVSAVIKEKVIDYEDFPGRMEAINSVDIRARVTGFLTVFNFKEGSIVKKGDVLFEIDARPYKAELDRTEGIIMQMDGRLKRLEADFSRGNAIAQKRRQQRRI